MPRPLSFQPDGEWTLFEVTTRCIQSRFLLKPSREATVILVGVLGEALRHYGRDIRLHFGGGTSNHFHLLLSSRTSTARAHFKCFLKTNISKEYGILYDWPETMFGKRSRDIPVLGEEAERDRVCYAAQHGIKEGLVSQREGWLGPDWRSAVLHGKPLRGEWYDRTGYGRALAEWEALPKNERGRKPTLWQFTRVHWLTLSPMPFMEHMSEDERRACWADLLEEATHRYPAPAHPPLGREKLGKQHPHTRPTKTKRSPAPAVHTYDSKLWDWWEEMYDLFVDAYRECWKRLRTALGSQDFAYAFPSGGVPPTFPTPYCDESAGPPG